MWLCSPCSGRTIIVLTLLGHVDSATMYRNEEPSAKGMMKSGVPREQLYFTSKVPPKEVTYEGAKKAIDESLQKTG